ncbi:adenylate kinase family enzyme [Bacillus pakistanensis]|uniref:Adenylate kinase family enzyme n=1 Tax=Rossellomorea pakistanensis TaxID=992288 RepID=A0ABS2NIN0_9BACI|nr:AAA family ATPase [Bacillus pakistanensis]MBM7587724.1 adenylate kinase family enzyme [Bacillus pakistanensis]
MESRRPKKIHIIGSVGSGKTTLARNLSVELNIPYYELDNVVWRRSSNGDIRRSHEERDRQLDSIVRTDEWIIEGVHHTWVSQGFEQAEMILFLDTSYSKRQYRITKRFIFQKLGLELANYQPTLSMFKKMFVWNQYFERESKPQILHILKEYEHKTIILQDNIEIKKYIG